MILSYTSGGNITFIMFDATIREEDQTAATVSEYHVEKGSDVADNVRPELDTVTMDVCVTDTPIAVPTSNTDGVSGGVAPKQLNVAQRLDLPISIPGVGAALRGAGSLDRIVTQSVQVLQFNGELHRVRSVHEDLRKLVKDATLVNLQSPRRTYTDFLITRVTAPYSAADGSSRTFTVAMKQVQFVESQVVAVKVTSGLAKQGKGPQPPKDPTQAESFLHDGKREGVKKAWENGKKRVGL